MKLNDNVKSYKNETPEKKISRVRSLVNQLELSFGVVKRGAKEVTVRTPIM